MKTFANPKTENHRPSKEEASGPEAGLLAWPTQIAWFAGIAAVLTAAFAWPLIHLMRYSWDSLLFSYIPFVPFISGFLIGLEREQLPRRANRSWTGALVCGTIGLGLLAFYWGAIRAGAHLQETQGLACAVTAFLVLLLGAAFFLFGSAIIRAVAFPVALCFFMVPFPSFLLDPVIDFMRTTSIWTAHAFLLLARTPHVLDGMTLVMPNASLLVTPDCSGFHAGISLVLTALFAGYLFLRSGWNRLWFLLVSVPLAVVRNGFRIFILSEMCFHEGQQALESPVHSQGGKLFFALSLIPLFLFLIFLHKAEKRRQSYLETAKMDLLPTN